MLLAGMRWTFPALLPLALVSAAPSAWAGEREPPLEPAVHPTLAWAAFQLVPSPEVAAGDGGARFGMRWQITPVLYSWGIHRGLSPWRVAVVEPNVRQSGSIELFTGPEVLTATAAGWGLRSGVRSYFPLIEHGEYLSVSLGASHLLLGDRSTVAGEVGAYVLFGGLGAQITLSPSGGPASFVATLRVRYF